MESKLIQKNTVLINKPLGKERPQPSIWVGGSKWASPLQKT